MFFEPDLTEEEKAERKIALDRAQMKSEELAARIRRLLAEELDYEQLEALSAIFSHVANSQRSADIANWYEGMVNGVLMIRDLVLGEKPAPTDELG